MVTEKDKNTDLKQACLQAAREVIALSGVESLSMREVARQLGVSHQAPYRHFESRDHLLAEVIKICFIDFANFLDQRGPAQDSNHDLFNMGLKYIEYAELKPLEYRLMFSTPWPEPANYPDLTEVATHAFNILRQAMRQRHGKTAEQQAKADLDALYIWSTLHGMSSLKNSNFIPHLDLQKKVLQRFKEDVMCKIGLVLSATDAQWTRRKP